MSSAENNSSLSSDGSLNHLPPKLLFAQTLGTWFGAEITRKYIEQVIRSCPELQVPSNDPYPWLNEGRSVNKAAWDAGQIMLLNYDYFNENDVFEAGLSFTVAPTLERRAAIHSAHYLYGMADPVAAMLFARTQRSFLFLWVAKWMQGIPNWPKYATQFRDGVALLTHHMDELQTVLQRLRQEYGADLDDRVDRALMPPPPAPAAPAGSSAPQ